MIGRHATPYGIFGSVDRVLEEKCKGNVWQMMRLLLLDYILDFFSLVSRKSVNIFCWLNYWVESNLIKKYDTRYINGRGTYKRKVHLLT
jgi:hypothetical protein